MVGCLALVGRGGGAGRCGKALEAKDRQALGPMRRRMGCGLEASIPRRYRILVG
jgi:hypothetical protein